MFTLNTFTPSNHLINFNTIQSLISYLKHTNKNLEHIIIKNSNNTVHIISYNQLIKLPSNHPFFQ